MSHTNSSFHTYLLSKAIIIAAAAAAAIAPHKWPTHTLFTHTHPNGDWKNSVKSVADKNASRITCIYDMIIIFRWIQRKITTFALTSIKKNENKKNSIENMIFIPAIHNKTSSLLLLSRSFFVLSSSSSHSQHIQHFSLFIFVRSFLLQ